MKILIAQTNTTPRDFEKNVEQIYTAIQKGSSSKVDLVITPELSIPGYSVKDLMYNESFIDDNLKYLSRIASFSIPFRRSMHIVVGYIDKNRTGHGKPFRNMAAVIRSGKIIATYQKQLLPCSEPPRVILA